MKFLPGTPTPKPTAKAIREAIAMFDETGESGLHSTAGVLLSHILNHCAKNGIAFRLAFEPGGGYYVWRRPNGADFGWQPAKGSEIRRSAAFRRREVKK